MCSGLLRLRCLRKLPPSALRAAAVGGAALLLGRWLLGLCRFGVQVAAEWLRHKVGRQHIVICAGGGEGVTGGRVRGVEGAVGGRGKGEAPVLCAQHAGRAVAAAVAKNSARAPPPRARARRDSPAGGLSGTHLPLATVPAGSALLRCWLPTLGLPPFFSVSMMDTASCSKENGGCVRRARFGWVEWVVRMRGGGGGGVC